MASDERARRMAQIDYRLTAESYFGDEAREGVPWLLGTLEQANARIAALEAEVARLREAAQAYIDAYDAALKAPLQYAQAEEYCHAQRYNLRAALAARGGEAAS